MIKVVVASLNPVKNKAVEEAFLTLFKVKIDIQSIDVPSEVKEQPLSDLETFKGASNRAKNSRNIFPEADYWVGIEGGVDLFESDYYHAFGWVYIMRGEKVSFSRSSTFPLSIEITDMINKGKELGTITDELFGLKESKKKGGIIGVLTNGVVDRKELYVQPVQFALIPFLNH